MWLPNALPVSHLQRNFGFTPTPAWADHLRKASVQIGASGAFISPDGLVLTNEHVAAWGLQSVSQPGKDYLTNGFLARRREDEIRIPGGELNVLQSIEDVTQRVKAAVDPKQPPDEAFKARRAVFAEIERQSQETTGLKSRIVTLYGGALYHLYRYKRYDDLRIVFAPEQSIGFFGGDPDNFEFPRFDLDIALLRAYENGKPAHVTDWLPLSRQGVREGDLVFVSGHPGQTSRLLPVSTLKRTRDALPLRLEMLERQRRALLDYSALSPEAKRQAQSDIFYLENSLKAMRANSAALNDWVIELKQKQEDALRAQVRARSDLRDLDAAWDRIESINAKLEPSRLRSMMLDGGSAFSSGLFRYARNLVRLPAEDAKPNGQRLPEFSDAGRASLRQALLADEPFYPEKEIVTLTASLKFFQDTLGADSPDVRKVLGDSTPADVAQRLVRGSKLGSVAERRRLFEGGQAAIDASDDTMIQLAKSIDADARSLRAERETISQPQADAMTQINRARFEVTGTDTYPDATGTLRLAFGVVKGYLQDNQQIAPWTTIGGAFAHEKEHNAAPPYQLPQSWTRARDQLDPAAPLNFISTADITGGNSGSPVVNRAGELVGVIFDSNRQGIVTDFAYSDTQARAVAVDSRAIFEAMTKIYHADELVNEIKSAADARK